MEKQVNIPALGIVCLKMCMLIVRALYGYTFRKNETAASAKVKLSMRCA